MQLKRLYSVEYGSDKYLGKIIKTYTQDQVVETTVKIHANHKGTVQFRVCEAPPVKGDPSRECFEKNQLKFENGQVEVNLMSGVSRIAKEFTFKVQLGI